jgi:hypothetical protein
VAQAEQIWSWTKNEGGDLAQLSHKDIQEMVASAHLRDDVVALIARHQAATLLCEARVSFFCYFYFFVFFLLGKLREG